MAVVAGRILRIDEVRGYGFIARDGGGEDVFVHVNDLVEDKYWYRPGTPVEFEIAEGERGLKALAVRIRKPAAGSGQQKRPPTAAAPTSADYAPEDDGLCDVLPASEFSQEITELILRQEPTLTGQQIVRLRQLFIELAAKYGWVEV